MTAGRRGLGEQQLVEEVWGGDQVPANPTKALQVVVSRARAATTPAAVERTARGYRLALGRDEVDAWALRPQGLALAAQGRYAEALPLLERAHEQAGPDDEVTEALLRAVAAVHGVPAALERYESYRVALADRLGVDPAPVLQALHAELLARDRPVRSGLRYDADALIGRETDVAAVSAMVRTARLVSLVGAGGLGKTRLAHVIGRQAEQPVVHFVALAGVASPEDVTTEVADVLGVRESVASRNRPRAEDPVTRIVDAIGTAPTLLILDNCEHVVSAVAGLVSVLLARTPALTVLTTSRAPLGLAAERVYLLPELSLDDGVALFTERATAARPGVSLDPGAVRRLVARLDGLPLAVELAAAKVRVMSVAEIDRRLDNRFALLRGGSRDAPERHQTLLAVIDWSWNLLTEEQRVALRRLSVFRDGFSLDGAAAVVGEEAVELVTALVDQSLVTVRDGDPVRYRLLETVREFGAMQLVDAGDDVAARARLRDWGVRLAHESTARLFSPDQVATMAALRPEEGNLVDVLRAALADRDVAAVVELFAALAGFWTIEGSHLKVIGLAGQVEEVVLAAPVEPALADAFRLVLASIVTNRIIFSRAGGVGAASARLRELGPGGEPRVRATVEVVLALVGAGTPQEQTLALARLAGDPDPGVARHALSWMSQALENAGDLAGARRAAERALGLADDRDGPWTRALLQAQLAGLALQDGDVPTARQYAASALPLLTELGAWDDVVQTRGVEAMAALRAGDLDEAERILDDIDTHEAAQSVLGGAIIRLTGRAELLLARGETDAGLAAYREAVELLRARDLPGVELAPDFAPWVMFPESAAVAAYCRAGRPEQVRGFRDRLRDKLVALLDGSSGLLDFPVAGCALFALGAFELATAGPTQTARRLLRCATGLAFNRMLPSLDLAWAEQQLGEPVTQQRPAPEVRDEALALVRRL